MENVRKRCAAMRSTAEGAKRVRTTRQSNIVASFVSASSADHIDADATPAQAVLVLLRLAPDEAAMQAASTQGLKTAHDAVDFFQRVRGRAAASARGDLALAPPMADNDYTIAARLVAGFVSAYLAEARDFCAAGRALRLPA